MKPEALKRLVRIANDPYGCLTDLRKKKRIIGSTLADVPEEVIHAAGLHPFLILGTNHPIRHSAALLPDNSCSLARSNLELVIGYQAAFFDGFILSQVCDTTQHLCDIWRRKFPAHYFENFLAPRQVARPSARAWYAQECRRLRSALEGYTGRKIADEDLQGSFRLYNENRSLLRRLYVIKQDAAALMTNREFFDCVKATFFMAKEEHNRLVREVVDWAERNKDGFIDQAGNFKVIMAGIVVEPPTIYDLIDEVQGNIVADNLCTASRYIYHDVEVGPDPAEALADRHLRKPLFSPINADPERIYADLVELYRAAGAEAIFYCHIKYCESQDYDLPDIKARMREQGIPFLELETEYQTTRSSQMRTRVQAFCESVIKQGGIKR
ncbi:MAG: 2-hydroxyacyl-CoA dehydratase family protein [Desulfobacterales bacterium]|nr:2-hydroxyacyl-CoA dehydratase family protein [Desulfobacterales bacterium]